MVESLIALLPQGVLYSMVMALLALGMMLPFRLLDVPDLTAEGSFPLGGAVMAYLLLHQVALPFALAGAMGAGILAGLVTSGLYLKFRIPSLLAGIIVATMLYSVELRLLGVPNVALFEVGRGGLDTAMGLLQPTMMMIGVVLLVVLAMRLWLASEFGLRLRAVGSNQRVAALQGVKSSDYVILGLVVGNAIVALAGGCQVVLQSYMDVGMGVGIIIHGLAALLLGELIMRRTTLTRQLLAPIVGAILYQQIYNMVLAAGCAPSDMKLLMGGIVILLFALQQLRKETKES